MNGISITDVSYQINDTAILRSVSFQSVAKRIAILGRNGSGKSTLSRLICGLDRPNQGVIRVNDIDVYKDRRAALNTVGMIFQNPDHQIIFPTVIEEMVFGLTQMGVDKPAADQRAMSYLSKFGKSTGVIVRSAPYRKGKKASVPNGDFGDGTKGDHSGRTLGRVRYSNPAPIDNDPAIIAPNLDIYHTRYRTHSKLRCGDLVGTGASR